MNKILKNTTFESVKLSNDNFSKHFHDTYTIGITYDGVLKSFNTNQKYDSFKYTSRVNNPGEVHGGVSNAWSHSNFYPNVELLSSIYEDIFFEKRIPIFQKHVISDKILFFKLHNFFINYYNKEDTLLVQSSLIEALSYLIINYTSHSKKSFENIFDDKRVVKKSYELISDNLDTNFDLKMLAKNSNMSKFHFLRVFKKELGITPHNFIINQRVNKAISLINNGVSLAEASFQVGFNDQSHFTRNFKKLYGYTPSKIIKK
ncbi:AraC family transcriptional regulator [Malaciobacter halophilus]|uniref:AraC family transcriptional regulator n=1 Tax=Malaciobacter halophilus TaxID=197482 RepID=A0A2N1J3G0_9BACT|nr:AraC family transcriptional regulator [Malaciobacter halophilus]AXH09110.1 transcriptional regulator, AraC family [Malaciobacter halophilus]PKI81093.1 AraC family transcriptional regulator [Malaciobacter halophilus]